MLLNRWSGEYNSAKICCRTVANFIIIPETWRYTTNRNIENGFIWFSTLPLPRKRSGDTFRLKLPLPRELQPRLQSLSVIARPVRNVKTIKNIRPRGCYCGFPRGRRRMIERPSRFTFFLFRSTRDTRFLGGANVTCLNEMTSCFNLIIRGTVVNHPIGE